MGGYDGNPGLGQQMTALETIQALLAFDAQPPFKFGEIKHVKKKDPAPSPSSTSPPSNTQQPDSVSRVVAAIYLPIFVVFITSILIVGV